MTELFGAATNFSWRFRLYPGDGHSQRRLHRAGGVFFASPDTADPAPETQAAVVALKIGGAAGTTPAAG